MLRYAITDGSCGSVARVARELGCSVTFAAADVTSASPLDSLPAQEPAAWLRAREALGLQIRCLVREGVQFIQLREKGLSAGALAELAGDLLRETQGSATRLLINSRADIAVAEALDGVHLTAAPGELKPSQIRMLYDQAGLRKPFVSCACHTHHQVATAREEAADLILFSPVFEKVENTVPIGKGVGLASLRAACASASPVPVVALGGVTPENAAECLTAGAAGVAGIRLFRRTVAAHQP